MLARLPFRLLALLLFAVCAGMLAFGLYLQHAKGIEPCPMCIMQRYALATCGLIGLLAGLHNPGRRGVSGYALLLAIAALAGLGVAARALSRHSSDGGDNGSTSQRWRQQQQRQEWRGQWAQTGPQTGPWATA